MAAAAEVAEETVRRGGSLVARRGTARAARARGAQGIVDVYVRHSAMLRTSVEVTTYDPEFAAFYNELMERFVAATADQLRRDRDAGRLRDLDPTPSRESLVWMVERCNNVLIGHRGSLAEARPWMRSPVWVHALYPDSVSPGSGILIADRSTVTQRAARADRVARAWRARRASITRSSRGCSRGGLRTRPRSRPSTAGGCWRACPGASSRSAPATA